MGYSGRQHRLPGPESGRFIEVEDDTGKSISVGEWIRRPDGLWALRIHGVNVVHIPRCSNCMGHGCSQCLDLPATDYELLAL